MLVLLTVFLTLVCGNQQLDVALATATRLGRSCSVAIGATSAHSAKFFARMDLAPPGSVELALARGYTAFEFNMPTSNLTKPSSPGGSAFDLHVLGTYATGPGGYPLPSYGSVGVACEFYSQAVLDAADVIAQSVLNAPNTRVKEPVLQSVPAQGSLITLTQARFIADFIVSNIGTNEAAVVVVDAGGIMKYVTSTARAPNAFVKAAFRKAVATRFFDLPESSGLNDATQPGKPAYGLQITNGGLFPTAGGALILNKAGDQVTQALGAVAVQGSFGEKEATAIVQKALAAFYANTKPLLKNITLRDRRGVTSSEAQEAIRAAIKYRKELGDDASPGVYAVRDLSGSLRAFYYEDGVEKGAADIALKSSLATSLFRIPSEGVGSFSRPNQSLYNIELLYGGLVSFESAFPLTSADGATIGSIGVSGTGKGKGTSNDAKIARKAALVTSGLVDPCAESVEHCNHIVAPIVPIDLSAPSPFTDEIISLAQVAGLIEAVQQYDNENDQRACVSVFDAGVRLKGQLCANDAFLGATDLTQRKAMSGQAFGKPNQDLQGGQLPSGIVYKIEVTNGGLFFNGGGAPLKINGHTVGSVGVAGAADDIAAVAPAVQAWDAHH